ncbi:putative neutral ceramidase superfamily lipid hydrolase [Natronospira proteinivora]|uniref:Neutral ceramidase superfamily lipid hydrolase n=1 Tax=Natronospira proteinivora TaxID=1807133 RepID=A0ABT1G5M1_9GAMM|nr:hypothetical protein [Natronospira proteinivora]MCP1726602.1 putative neutral ceramidase superfamily lipid hydrolase [Natronospira proteinivora]
MKIWLFAILFLCLVLALGFGLMGAGFFDVVFFNAPVVNLLMWAGLVCLAGLAFTGTGDPGMHRAVTGLLLFLAVAWFPVSLLIFGNARFSGTSEFLWSIWLVYTAGLPLLALFSLCFSGVRSYLKHHPS